MNQDSAAQFTVNFERAYLVNTWVKNTDNMHHLDISLGEENVAKRGKGFVVRFDVRTTLGYENPEPTDTPPLTIVGHQEYRANYFVSDRLVMRSQSAVDESPNPIESGEIMQCSV